MKNNQYIRKAQYKKGFASLALVGLIVILLSVGVYFVLNKKSSQPNNQQVSSKLTFDILKNAEYYSQDTGTRIKLVNGTYPLTPMAGESQADYFVKLDADSVVFGDLNGDGQEDAVVILVSRSGGSGTYKELAVVLNQNGNANSIANQALGDRTVVNSLTIQNGVISINITPWNGGGIVQSETINYKLVGDKLVRDSSPISQVDTSNWKTYTNTQYGFEVQYPPQLKPREEFNVPAGSGGVPSVVFDYPAISSYGRQENVIWAFNIVFSTDLKNLYQFMGHLDVIKWQDKGVIYIDGIAAQKLFSSAYTGGSTSYLIQSKNIGITLAGSDFSKISSSDLDQILSTFKFIK